MNPFSSSKLYGGHGKSKSSFERVRESRRRNRQQIHKSAKLRQHVGILDFKKNLCLGLLNVDGLGEAAFEDVKNTVLARTPDLCVILETKRRFEKKDRTMTLKDMR